VWQTRHNFSELPFGGLMLAVSTLPASLQGLASALQHHRIKLIQQLVEFYKHLAGVGCRCARCFQMFKLGELLLSASIFAARDFGRISQMADSCTRSRELLP
jgi:hypothetical protein